MPMMAELMALTIPEEELYAEAVDTLADAVSQRLVENDKEQEVEVSAGHRARR